VPDEKPEKPLPLPVPIDRNAEDAIEPDPIQDEIERLDREAQPKQKLCPHCGKPLPKDE